MINHTTNIQSWIALGMLQARPSPLHQRRKERHCVHRAQGCDKGVDGAALEHNMPMRRTNNNININAPKVQVRKECQRGRQVLHINNAVVIAIELLQFGVLGQLL